MRLSILLMALGVTAASALSAQAPSAGAGDAKAPAGNADKGKELYVSYGCYQCHNYAAHGGGAGPKLAPNPMAFPAFIRQIREPRDQMPPYTAKVMTDQEVADIYAFLETIPPAPAPATIPILQP
jgi:ubiquinol-cytochrome c reductase cytochrome c subunit